MNKAEFVELLCKKTQIKKNDCFIILESAKDIILEVCSKGGEICFRGFGKFKAKNRDSHRCMNPQTKRFYFSKSKKFVIFKGSKNLI